MEGLLGVIPSSPLEDVAPPLVDTFIKSLEELLGITKLNPVESGLLNEVTLMFPTESPPS